jgi:hypothetical protein
VSWSVGDRETEGLFLFIFFSTGEDNERDEMGCAVSKKQGGGASLRGLEGDAAAAAAAGADTSRNVRVKLVLLGDSGVGKSCIVLRFVRGQFDANSKVTVGAAFLSQTVSLPDATTTVKFEIWDTAGQERYASLAPLYYRGASAAAVVYDITSAESFQKARFWVKVRLGNMCFVIKIMQMLLFCCFWLCVVRLVCLRVCLGSNSGA